MSYKKTTGFTLIELMVAMTISAIVFTSAFVMVQQVVLAQKNLTISQSFYNEARIVSDRIVQMVRNNTIDYDRFWKETIRSNGNAYNSCFTLHFSGKFFSNQEQRGSIGSKNELNYPDVFLRDSSSSGSLDRNLGGAKNNPDDPTGKTLITDECTVAIGESMSNWDGKTLFLINSNRTVRQKIQWEKSTGGRGYITLETQLGADTDDDGQADAWSSNPFYNNGLCYLDTNNVVMGKPESEEFCYRAHSTQNIVPDSIDIENIQFSVSPIQDPYLAFRNKEAQSHPIVHIATRFILSNAGSFGFSAEKEPEILLQTAASSRVFGNTRK